jgi:hypothetical protein
MHDIFNFWRMKIMLTLSENSVEVLEAKSYFNTEVLDDRCAHFAMYAIVSLDRWEASILTECD